MQGGMAYNGSQDETKRADQSAGHHPDVYMSLYHRSSGETTVAEGVWEQEVNRIQDHLKRAILKGDAPAFGPAARELRHYWTLALVRGDRVGFRVVNAAMLAVAGMAHSYANPENPSDPLNIWHRVWAFIGEAGALLQEMNTDWTAEEKLAEIAQQRFLYAEQTLRFLDKEGMVTSASLLAHMSEAIERGQQEETGQGTQAEKTRRARASLNNHLRRLVGHGLVVRAGWGLYRLTNLGKHAAGIIEKRELRVEQPVVVETSPVGLSVQLKGANKPDNGFSMPGHVIVNHDFLNAGEKKSITELVSSGYAQGKFPDNQLMSLH